MQCYNLSSITGPRVLTSIMMSSQRKETFAQYVRRHRLAADMTQGALAQAARISQSYVSGIERGVNVQVDPDIVYAIADALKIDKAEAIRVAGSDVGYTTQEAARSRIPDLTILKSAEGYSDLDDEQRQIAEEEFEEAQLDAAAIAIARAQRKTRKRQSVGGTGEE